MNPAREVVEGDLLIEGDIITDVGEVSDDADDIIDASGCAVIPGLIQTHVHLTQRLFQGLADDMQLLDWLKKRIWPLEAAHTFDSNYVSATLCIGELIAGGTTSAVDMGTVNHTDAIFEAAKETGFRLMSGKCMMDHGAEVPFELMEDGEESLKESVRLAERWHGAENGRLDYAFAPRFVVSCTEGLLVRLREINKNLKLKIHTHASENRGEISLVESERGMRNIAYLKHLGLTDENLILAHCIWLDEEEKRILADTGTKISHCPSSNLKLASGIAHIPELLSIGCDVSLAADGSPCSNNLDMFTEMRHAALIQKTRLFDPTAMTASAVFEMATLAGAKAMGKSDMLGSLERGKKADIAIVNLETLHNINGAMGDIVSQLVYSVRASDVRTVIVDGKVLMRDRKMLTLDESETIRRAKSERNKIVDDLRHLFA